MRTLSLATHTLFADLQQKCLDASFLEHFAENGSFYVNRSKGREFLYYRGYHTGSETEEKRYSRYVGPADDPEIQKRVTEFAEIKASYRERRQLVSTLNSMGLPRSEPFSGDLVEALWKAGAFRLRSVLVGTTAFQTYAGLLGVRLSQAQLATGDVDVAQFHSVSMLVADTMPPMLETIRSLDPSFREIPHQADGRATCTYVNKVGYRLEFLTPNNSKEEYQDKPAKMAALGGASAQPLRFLDFLIHDPVHSVLLHKGGIPVLVPAPERYAIHKLIVAADRRKEGESAIKSRKDAAQAGALITALETVSRGADVGYAWIEAWERGPGWQRRLAEGMNRLNVEEAESLSTCVQAACDEDGLSISDFGFETRQPAI